MGDEFDTIIKRLKYFFEVVLHSAQNAGDWSLASFKQGLGWALYCEKTAHEPSYALAISLYLQSKPFKEDYTIQDIKSLRKLFISNLLVNQFVAEDLTSSIIESSREEFGEEQTLRLVDDAVKKVENYRMVIKIMRMSPYEHAFSIFKVRLLFEAVSSGSAPLSCLNNFLKENGLKALIDLSKTLPQTEKDNFFSCFGKWIESELSFENFNVQMFNQIAPLSSQNLSFLCNIFPGLHLKLLAAISFVGSKLDLEKDDFQCNEMYDILVTLSKTLFNLEDLSLTTKAFFSSMSSSLKYSFWHSLLMDSHK